MPNLNYIFPMHDAPAGWVWDFDSGPDLPAMRGGHVKRPAAQKLRIDPPVSNLQGGLFVTSNNRPLGVAGVSVWSRDFTPLELGVPAFSKVRSIRASYRFKWMAAQRARRLYALAYALTNKFRSDGNSQFAGPFRLYAADELLGQFSGKTPCPARNEDDDGANCWHVRPESDDTVGASLRSWNEAVSSEVRVDLTAESNLTLKLFSDIPRLPGTVGPGEWYWLTLRLTELTVGIIYEAASPNIAPNDATDTMAGPNDASSTFLTFDGTTAIGQPSDLSTTMRKVV